MHSTYACLIPLVLLGQSQHTSLFLPTEELSQNLYVKMYLVLVQNKHGPTLSLLPGPTAVSFSENANESELSGYKGRGTQPEVPFPNGAFSMLFRRTGASNPLTTSFWGYASWGYSTEG